MGIGPGRRRVAAAAALLSGLSLAAGPAPARAAAVRPCSRGLVALTFDDGPSTAVTAQLLDVLSARRVPATFFVVGQRVAAAPKLVRAADRRGFAVANHSYAHELLTALSDDGIRSTLRRTSEALRRAGVRPVALMRPPYGAIDARVRSVIAGLGLTPVLWDIDPRDWNSGSSADIAARVLDALTPGGRNIVLLHDGVQRSTTTLGAVPAIVRGARARGYCFADLGPAGGPVPPVPRLRVADATVTEPEPGVTATLRFALRLDRPTSRPVSVRVRTAGGSAAAGADFVTFDQVVVLPAGTRTHQVVVRALGDRIDETRERLTLRLSRPRRLSVPDATAVGTIRDDDPAPVISLSDATVDEPDSGSVLVPLGLLLDRPSSRRVLVTLATSPGTAGDSDYVPFEVVMEVAAGQRRIEVPVEVLADAVDEPEESFQVRVLDALRATIGVGTATVTIMPPQEPPARVVRARPWDGAGPPSGAAPGP